MIILCEKECGSCGAPMGQVWAREVAPGERVRLGGRNQTDQEIGERFFQKYPQLRDAEVSETHFGTCWVCYSPY